MSDAILRCDNTRVYPIGDAQPQHLAAVGNGQGLLSHMGRGQHKKRVPLRVGSWNIRTMTERGAELADTLRRRRVNIACLQETKWKGAKAKEIVRCIEFTGWMSRQLMSIKTSKNCFRILEDKRIDIVIVNRVNDRLILVKLSIGELIINVISAYALQVGVDAGVKKQFWEDLATIMTEIPTDEEIFIGADFNGHVGKNNAGYERVHGGKGFGGRNFEAACVLQMATAYDLVVVSTYFDKCEEHLIIYNSRDHKSQIDYLLTRWTTLKRIKDCKVIPGDDLTSQHRFLVMELNKMKNGKSVGPDYIPIEIWKVLGEEGRDWMGMD
ncbi:craniofacial development protein 2-like [Centruroides sculpturatus]|uniref:craniofacial development protein 2-like n=1 Tax=Centruroides sculpturatus TaxID=218467 RepID=UPI000C6C9435|nr:craniofacial development protein 2-like [Centruroides sculpturatus]